MSDPRGLPTDIAVVAVGARTPLGLDACQTGFLYRAGYAAMAEAPLGPDGEPVTMCVVSALAPDVFATERASLLASAALVEALAAIPAGLVTAGEARLLLCLDPPDGEQARAEALRLCTRLQRRAAKTLPDISVESVLHGEASASLGLPDAVAALTKGDATLVVLGGVHTAYDPATIARLDAEGRLYASGNLDATIAGECAAFVVLASTTRVAELGLSPLAYLCAVGQGMESARPDNLVPAATARGMTTALHQVSAPLEHAGLRAGWTLTDVTFEMRRQVEWQSICVRANHVLGPPYYMDSPALRMGTLGAAALPLHIAMAAEAWRGGYAPANIALAFAGSETGERGAVLLASAMA